MIDRLRQKVNSWVISGIEGRKIEMKSEFPLESKDSKAKFAKLITAIANSPGGTGYFIIGVVDKRKRTGESLNEIIIGITYEQDVYQRQIQQALNEFSNPIPLVEYQEVSFPKISKKIGVIVVKRSHNKPHEVTRECGSVKPEIYIRRGAETFQTNREDILSMTATSSNHAIIVNFTHPITQEQLNQIKANTGLYISEIAQPPTVPIHFQDDISFEEQVITAVDAVGLTDEEWQELQILVNLPGFAYITAALIAELHGRMGHFPKVLRLRRSQEDANRYEFEEIIQLQRVRDKARARR